ncbi:MAG: YHS domain-containing protein [Candidatus Omnitrophica bacterium]|nr:YHS domain-containing protein [Candidatus Omnitrophota bacterium]
MVKIILVLTIGVLMLLGLGSAVCAAKYEKASESQEPAQTYTEQNIEPVGEAKEEKDDTEAFNVGNKICPVSGEKVGQAGMEPVTFEYEGKIFNFCCAACIDEFKKDPSKYIQKVEEELMGEPQQKSGHDSHEGHSDY